MNNINLSILVPTIRPKNLLKYFNSICEACKRYSFEVVFISPYLIPEELMKDRRVKYIRSYANPTVCLNMAAALACGEFIMNSTDDGIFAKDSLDAAMDLASTIGLRDLVNFIYEEGSLDSETLEPLSVSQSYQPPGYWKAGFHSPLRLPGINPLWDLCLHFIIRRKFFEELGYLDTQFSYVNMNLHIMAFTAQTLGSKVHHTPFVGFFCSHLEGNKGDHFAINSAASEEQHIFNEIYSYNNPLPITFDKNAWKELPIVWTKRFDSKNLPLEPPKYS